MLISIRMQSSLSFEAWFWTWGFFGLSLACPLVAIPLYIYKPTEWSATIAFVRAAAQGFVTLQAMFTASRRKAKAD